MLIPLNLSFFVLVFFSLGFTNLIAAVHKLELFFSYILDRTIPWVGLLIFSVRFFPQANNFLFRLLIWWSNHSINISIGNLQKCLLGMAPDLSKCPCFDDLLNFDPISPIFFQGLHKFVMLRFFPSAIISLVLFFELCRYHSYFIIIQFPISGVNFKCPSNPVIRICKKALYSDYSRLISHISIIYSSYFF